MHPGAWVDGYRGQILESERKNRYISVRRTTAFSSQVSLLKIRITYSNIVSLMLLRTLLDKGG